MFKVFNPCHAKPEYIAFENSVDPDQLASEKPADQDPHCFPLCLLIIGILQVD